MKYSVPKIWTGETAIILAGGPSLKDFDLSRVYRKDGGPTPGFKIITINDSWRLAPYAAVKYFCDQKWWQDSIQKNPRAVGVNVSFHEIIYRPLWINGHLGFLEHPQVKQLSFTGQTGLETDPAGLRHGSNSGYQAINLAAHFGVKKIVLLGYDMRVIDRTHWHEGHGQTLRAFAYTIQQSFIPHFETLREPLKGLGIEVINATPDSALNAFSKMSLEEALELPAVAGKRSIKNVSSRSKNAL